MDTVICSLATFHAVSLTSCPRYLLHVSLGMCFAVKHDQETELLLTDRKEQKFSL